jgi:hypothetical protein
MSKKLLSELFNLTIFLSVWYMGGYLIGYGIISGLHWIGLI